MKKKFLRGFTLIELLVVITIIGILASLAIPAINGVLKAAKKVEARTMMSSMQNAVVNYQTEYSTYPPFMSTNNAPTLSSVGDWEDFYIVLAAPPNLSVTNNNSRQISFLTISPKYLYDGSATAPSADPTSGRKNIRDPFGKLYKMWVDMDYDNVLKSVYNLSGTTTTAKDIPGSVAVWSAAADDVSMEPASLTAKQLKNSVGTWK